MIRTFVDGWDFSPDQLLTGMDVARMFRVGSATVAKWAAGGQLACIRTPGGHRRFSRQQVEHFMANPGGLVPDVVPPLVQKKQDS